MRGDHSFDTAPPADIRQNCTFEKSNVSRSLHLSVFSPNDDLQADGAAGSEGIHLVDGEKALGKDRQHLPADIAGGADDGDVVAHGWLLR